jgi:hypothetical protein
MAIGTNSAPPRRGAGGGCGSFPNGTGFDESWSTWNPHWVIFESCPHIVP